MGDHDTLYTVLMPEFWARLTNAAESSVFGKREWEFMMFGATHYTLIHVASALIAVVFLIFAAMRWRATGVCRRCSTASSARPST